MDGSLHDRFGGRGPWCCLMVMVDDATGTVFARFYERGDAGDVVRRVRPVRGGARAAGGGVRGRAGTCRPDLGGDGSPMQFGRAMATLGVELILANSPQAKGRTEWANRTLQDRLVKEMGLRGVSDIAAANALLDGTGTGTGKRTGGEFLADLNGRFAVPAERARPDLQWRVTAAVRLDEVPCAHEERAVGPGLVRAVAWSAAAVGCPARGDGPAAAGAAGDGGRAGGRVAAGAVRRQDAFVAGDVGAASQAEAAAGAGVEQQAVEPGGGPPVPSAASGSLHLDCGVQPFESHPCVAVPPAKPRSPGGGRRRRGSAGPGTAGPGTLSSISATFSQLPCLGV